MTSREVQISGPGNNCGSMTLLPDGEGQKVAVTIPVASTGGHQPGFKAPEIAEPWLSE